MLDSIRVFLKETKIREIMTAKVISIAVDAPFSEVPKKLNNHLIRHLPVVDDSGRLVGLMTQRDLFKIHSPQKLEDGNWYYDEDLLNGFILKDVMIANPKTLGPDECVGEAVLLMVRQKIGCVPVVDQNRKLCGIITQADFLKLAARIYAPQFFTK